MAQDGGRAVSPRQTRDWQCHHYHQWPRRGCGCWHWLWEMSPVVSQVTSVRQSVPGCPSVGWVGSCSPDTCKRGWRWGQSSAGACPAHGSHESLMGHRQGGEERKAGDPFPCQAVGIHQRKKLLRFSVLNPAAGAQKMGIVLLWGNLRGVWTSIRKMSCHKPGSKGKSRSRRESQIIPRTVHEDTASTAMAAMCQENHG